jgi:hypothetical protein
MVLDMVRLPGDDGFAHVAFPRNEMMVCWIFFGFIFKNLELGNGCMRDQLFALPHNLLELGRWTVRFDPLVQLSQAVKQNFVVHLFFDFWSKMTSFQKKIFAMDRYLSEIFQNKKITQFYWDYPPENDLFPEKMLIQCAPFFDRVSLSCFYKVSLGPSSTFFNKFLKKANHLTHLNISGLFDTDFRFQNLFKAMKNNPTITHLDASLNVYQPECLKIISDMVKCNKKLLTLNLKSCIMIEMDRNLARFFKAFRFNRTLKNVSFFDCMITPESTLCLQNLEKVSFSGVANIECSHMNIFHSLSLERRFVELSQLQKTTNNITVLHLAEATVTGFERFLKTFVHRNPILTDLDLTNVLHKDGFSVIYFGVADKIWKKVLKHNTALRFLSASFNRVETILNTLKRHNTTLKILGMNQFSVEFEALQGFFHLDLLYNPKTTGNYLFKQQAAKTKFAIFFFKK